MRRRWRGSRDNNYGRSPARQRESRHLKPQIAYKIAATREAIEKAFGPKVGELFVPNPTVREYAAVVRFPSDKVVGSGAVNRSLKKLNAIEGAILFIARDLTVEARQVAQANRCDVVTRTEFGWTDAAYQTARQR